MSFSLYCGLSCSNGDLVIPCYNKMHDDILYLDWWYLSPTWVWGKTLIHQGHIRSEEEACKGRWELDSRGDILIQGLLEIQTDAIITFIFGDADTDTYKYETTDKLLDCWEKKGSDKHGNHCHDQKIHFSLFLLLVYGMVWKEALVLLQNLSRLVT